MEGLAALYQGKVTHVRHTPFIQRFAYQIWMLRIELADIPALAQRSGWFSHNRFGILSIYDRDHGYRDGRPLRPYVEAALAAQGLESFAHKIVFITMPRFLGYAFNPISFYFCYDAAGELGAVLHQVKNTFGGQIGYLMPIHASRPIRQTAPKKMYVSPFFDNQGGYRFALTPPDENFTISILYGTETEQRMTAAMSLKAQPWDTASLLRLMLRMPFTPMKVIFAIHFEALKLFLRGAKFHPLKQETNDLVIAGETL